LDLQLLMQSVLIITNIVSSNPTHGEVYSICDKSLLMTCGRLVVFSGYFGFPHQ